MLSPVLRTVFLGQAPFLILLVLFVDCLLELSVLGLKVGSLAADDVCYRDDDGVCCDEDCTAVLLSGLLCLLILSSALIVDLFTILLLFLFLFLGVAYICEEIMPF